MVVAWLITALQNCQGHWDTPKSISQALLDSSRIGHFPYSSNSEMSVSIPLKKERKKEKEKIMHDFLTSRYETSKLTLGPGCSSLHTPHSSGLHMHHHSPEMDDDINGINGRTKGSCLTKSKG